MTRRHTAILAAALAFAGPACSNAFDLPDRDPAIEGQIVSVGEAALAPGRSAIRLTMHVKEIPTEGDPCGIIFRVTDATTIGFRPVGGPPRPASIDELQVGVYVTAWADGGIAESCPAQAATEAIELQDVDFARSSR